MIPAATLERLLDRFHAVEAELASGTAGNSFVKLSKEHAELAPVVEAAQAFRETEKQLKDAETLISDPSTDPEMRTMAEEERAELKTRFAEQEHDLQIRL